jgi:ATP synthase protein I
MPEPDKDNQQSLASLSQAIEAAKKRNAEKNNTSSSGGAGNAARVGVELMAGVAVGVLAGYWLDKWLGTSPLFFLGCFFLGVTGSGMNIYRMSKRTSGNDASGSDE